MSQELPAQAEGIVLLSKLDDDTGAEREVSEFIHTTDSVFHLKYKFQPSGLAIDLFTLYQTNSTVNRAINQVVEQTFADGVVKPDAGNKKVQEFLDVWWQENVMDLKLLRGFKQWLLSGEHWLYIPKVGKFQSKFGGQLLTSWDVSDVKGIEPETWESAQYRPTNIGTGEAIANQKTVVLNPGNTGYTAHDPLFGSLRGIPPFASLLFAVLRYSKWLDARERINNVASNVVAEMHFGTLEEAGRSLGWKKDAATGSYKPEPVKLPARGTVVVTIGEQGKFNLTTPTTRGGDATADGNAFWQNVVEGTRLPEYMSGNGANVNVATAKVQYPFAIRAIIALRDEYTYGTVRALRVLLRMAANKGLIPASWEQKIGSEPAKTVTPETCLPTFSWPEIRELDFEGLFNTLMQMLDRGLIPPEELLKQLGYDPSWAAGYIPMEPKPMTKSTGDKSKGNPAEKKDEGDASLDGLRDLVKSAVREVLGEALHGSGGAA